MRATDDYMENAGLAGSESVGYAAGRSQQCQTKDKVVTVRMTTDDAGDLAYVREQLGSGSGPEAVRETVRIAAAVLRGEHYKASRTRHDALRADVPEEVMVSVRGALQANADSHSSSRVWRTLGIESRLRRWPGCSARLSGSSTGSIEMPTVMVIGQRRCGEPSDADWYDR